MRSHEMSKAQTFKNLLTHLFTCPQDRAITFHVGAGKCTDRRHLGLNER